MSNPGENPEGQLQKEQQPETSKVETQGTEQETTDELIDESNALKPEKDEDSFDEAGVKIKDPYDDKKIEDPSQKDVTSDLSSDQVKSDNPDSDGVSEDSKEVGDSKVTGIAEDTEAKESSGVTEPEEVPVAKPTGRPVLTWHGQRPFAGAVDMYKREHLHSAITAAKEYLDQNPHHFYARVLIRLFDSLDVLCTDQYGNQSVKKFTVHEVHYGPEVKNIQFPYPMPPEEFKWRRFEVRSNYIWVLMNQGEKLPGGDGSGRDGTACSPFRDAQVALAQEGLFLIDSSQTRFDPDTRNFWYDINIRLYRTIPSNGPFPRWHGYGHIPGLGVALAKHEAKQEVDQVKDDGRNYGNTGSGRHSGRNSRGGGRRGVGRGGGRRGLGRSGRNAGDRNENSGNVYNKHISKVKLSDYFNEA